MFRRKEEDSADASVDSAAQGSVSVSASSTGSLLQEPAASPSASAASSHASSYAPAASSVARPAAPTAVATSYRPAATSEFTRPSPARAVESQRASSPAVTAAAGASSFTTVVTDKNGQKANRRVLTVGNDILLKGEIATCDRLVIEGRVEAKLSDVHTVEIAECGSFKGTAEVEDAEISGVFEGDLIVRNRLVIYTSGEVRGNITYGEIEIERGGRLTGQIKTVAVGAAAAAPQAVAGKTGLTAQEVKARAASKEFA